MTDPSSASPQLETFRSEPRKGDDWMSPPKLS